LDVSKCTSKAYIFGRFELIGPLNFSFKDGLSINNNVYINASAPIQLGENVSLSAGSSLISTGIIFSEKGKMKEHTSSKIIIGDNVQIGAGAIVLGGVTICDNVLVGAGAVVNKNIDEAGIYVGVPARKIK
jgi:maltose O-acetyltransferase